MLMRDEVPKLRRRVGSVVVDLIMLELAMIPIALALREVTPSPTVIRLLEFGIAVVYSTVFLGARGQTPGKTMASLRVISVDGTALNQRQALVRSVLKWGTIFVPLILVTMLLPVPTTLQDVSMGSPMTPPDPHPLVALIPLAGIALVFFMMLLTRRHPDGRAPHDRVAETSVIQVV